MSMHLTISDQLLWDIQTLLALIEMLWFKTRIPLKNGPLNLSVAIILAQGKTTQCWSIVATVSRVCLILSKLERVYLEITKTVFRAVNGMNHGIRFAVNHKKLCNSWFSNRWMMIKKQEKLNRCTSLIKTINTRIWSIHLVITVEKSLFRARSNKDLTDLLHLFRKMASTGSPAMCHSQ